MALLNRLPGFVMAQIPDGTMTATQHLLEGNSHSVQTSHSFNLITSAGGEVVNYLILFNYVEYICLNVLWHVYFGA